MATNGKPTDKDKPSWGQCLEHTLTTTKSGMQYLSRIAGYAGSRGVSPRDMTDQIVSEFLAASPTFAAKRSHVNTMINRFNEVAAEFGLAPLTPLANSHTKRKAANSNLAPTSLAEIRTYIDSVNTKPVTKACKERRLLSAARRAEDLGHPLTTFRQFGAPLFLSEFSASFEDDPVLVTINSGRKRTLDEVGCLLGVHGYTTEEHQVRILLKNLPKAGLEMAESTARGVVSLDDPEADEFLMRTAIGAISAFAKEPSIGAMWQAQAAFGSLIVLQEVRDRDAVAEAWFEWMDEPGGRMAHLFIEPKAGQEGAVDIGMSDDSGIMQQLIIIYCRGVEILAQREPKWLAETRAGDRKASCGVSLDVARFWKKHGLPDISLTVLRDHVVTSKAKRGDREEVRDLSGTRYLNNAYHRYRGVIGTVAKDAAVNKAMGAAPDDDSENDD